jgi:hypothetical protein
MVGALRPVDLGLQRWAVEAAGGQGGRRPVSHDAGGVQDASVEGESVLGLDGMTTSKCSTQLPSLNTYPSYVVKMGKVTT